jgi:tRNA threonylcarbamoyladenosine biosynthesis protein TsaE
VNGGAEVIATDRPEETEAAGRRIAAQIEPGDVILLHGEVGAGKSTLIRAAMRELGVEGAIPSPTFTIGRSYEGKFPVSHLDLHRIGSIDAEDPGLLNEYFGRDRAVFVEWPGQDEPGLTADALRVRRIELTHEGGDSRRIEIGPIRHVT